MDTVLNDFVTSSTTNQLNVLEHLLFISKPEVKYYFQLKVNDITRYDVIKDLPIEVVEKVLLYLDLNTILKCRAVSRQWNAKVNQSTLFWIPQLRNYCIDINSFMSEELLRSRSVSRATLISNSSLEEERSLNVIGERIFNSFLNNRTSSEDCLDVMHGGGIVFCNASHYIMGRKLLLSLQHQAHFQHIIDHDCRGSNVVMTMNDEILAYGMIHITLLRLVLFLTEINSF